MDPLRNPFSPGAGSPPPELVGRDPILEQARILLGRTKLKRPEKSMLLTGLRGVGKTVLLNEIERLARAEGYHTVLIEALAAGTQVISTNCPSGPREILQDGRLGALVPVGDAAALAAAIRVRLDHPSPPVPLETLEPFTSAAAVDHYLRIIEQVSGRTIDQEPSCSLV